MLGCAARRLLFLYSRPVSRFFYVFLLRKNSIICNVYFLSMFAEFGDTDGWDWHVEVENND